MSNKPRLIFDTNTIISHLLQPNSIPAQAENKGLTEGVLIVSSATRNELADVLFRPKLDS